MIEIRWHSRGGQGGVAASRLLVRAALKEEKWASASSFFGMQRRGSPIVAYNRIDEKKIRAYSAPQEPDYVLVLDDSLVEKEDVAQGVSKNGLIIVNGKVRGDFDSNFEFLDISRISKEENLLLEGEPIVNTPMLAAFSAATGVVSLEHILEAIENRFDERNANVARKVYNIAKSYGGKNG